MSKLVNMPGGVDKVMHSSINPWSVGELFPAVLARVESHLIDGRVRVTYEVLVNGEKWLVRVDRGGFYYAFNASVPPVVGDPMLELGNSYESLYDAAAALAKAIMMAKAVSEANIKSVNFDPPCPKGWDMVEAGFESIVDSPCPKGWDMVEAGFESIVDPALVPAESLASAVEDDEDFVDSYYWMEAKAVIKDGEGPLVKAAAALMKAPYVVEKAILAECSCDPEAASVDWFAKRPAHDLGERA